MSYSYRRDIIFIYVIVCTCTGSSSLTHDVSDVSLQLIEYHSGIEINAICIVHDSGITNIKTDTLKQKMYQKVFGQHERGFVGSIDLHRHYSVNESQGILQKLWPAKTETLFILLDFQNPILYRNISSNYQQSIFNTAYCF